MSELRVDKIATREGNKSIGTDVLIDSLDRNVCFENTFYDAKMVTGFVTRGNSRVTNTTSTVTLEPINGAQVEVYQYGVKYIIEELLTIDLSGKEKDLYVSFDPITYTLVAKPGNPDFGNDVLVAWVYVNPLDGIIWCGDERHSCSRNFEWHKSQHLDVGSMWRGGGLLQYDMGNPANLGMSFTTPIRIADEDLEHVIQHADNPSEPYQQSLANAKIPVLYLDGYHYKQTDEFVDPFNNDTLVGLRAKYNRLFNNSGELVDADNDTYITYHIVITNDMKNPVKMILGRGNYDNVDDALAEEFEEYGLSIPEIVPAYKLVLHIDDSYNNPAHAVINVVMKIVSRSSALNTNTMPDSHTLLVDREYENSHPITAITGLSDKLDELESAVGGEITASNGIEATGNLKDGLNISNKIGTSSGTVAAGNDSRIVNSVQNTRRVNGKALSADITLRAVDVGARPDTWDPVKMNVVGTTLNIILG